MKILTSLFQQRMNLGSDSSVVTMKNPTSIRVRVSRFLSDRYAYRAHPSNISEVVAFGLIVVLAIWPIFLLANAMALTLR